MRFMGLIISRDSFIVRHKTKAILLHMYSKNMHILYINYYTFLPKIIHSCYSDTRLVPLMKEEKGIIHRGEGAYLRCPISTSVHFSLRNEGSSEYIRLCEGRESLSPNFQTFRTPGISQFQWIRRLVSEPLYLLAHSHYYIWRRNWFHGNFCTP